ncbi:MAG: MATE family efflux transporter [Candidatus Cloacimonetes bacterium]|nr:MATE family efflux transporter [Candidatus Cloacimonadota bacterium]
MKHTNILSDNNIGRLLIKLSVPATIGMIVMALYNVVDAIFIGRSVGTLGIAGLAIAFPMHMIVLAFGTANGIGAASIISRAFGEGDLEKANKTFGNAMFSVIAISVLLTTFSLIFIEPLLRLFGATDEIMPYAKDYLSIIILGTIFFVFAISSNGIIRSEGHAKVAMGSMVVSAILNIIFDPIFIFWFNMGIRGAAWATVLAQFITVGYLLYFYSTGKSVLHIKWSSIHFNLSIQKEIFSIGMSSFARQIASSLLIIILNHLLALFGGIYIAIYAIINRVLRFVFMPIFGIAQGMQPILGYNYGARNYDNAGKVIKLAILHATAIGISGLIILYLFTAQIFSLFSNDSVLISKGIEAMRIVILALPFVGFQIIGATSFQALGKAVPALILSLARQVIILIPLLLIFSKVFGLNGIWASMPVADTLAALITFVFFVNLMRKLQTR